MGLGKLKSEESHNWKASDADRRVDSRIAAGPAIGRVYATQRKGRNEAAMRD